MINARLFLTDRDGSLFKAPPRTHLVGALQIMLLAGSLTLLGACTNQQTNEQRILQATQHIELPIRTLQARAELEILEPMPGIADELISAMIPDAPRELDAGSPEYQRAITPIEQIFAELANGTDQVHAEQEQTDTRRIAQATKLYARARGLRQAGEVQQAIELLKQAASLDPRSSSILRELGNTLIIANDRVGAIAAFERAVELGDRSPRALIHLATQESAMGNHHRVIWLAHQALNNRTINNYPLARSIAGVLLGTAEIDAGYLQAGAQTLGDALISFDSQSRDLRWKREIIQIISQRAQLWIIVGDAWGSIGADQRAQEAYANADSNPRANNPGADSGNGAQQTPIALVARQLGSALAQGRPASAALIFLDHLQRNATDLGIQELRWSKSLSTIEAINDVLSDAIAELAQRPGLTGSIRRSFLRIELQALDSPSSIARLGDAGLDADDELMCLSVLRGIEDESDRFEAATKIIAQNPGIARAIASGLTRSLVSPMAFMHEHAHPKTPSEELLIAAVGIGMGRADLIVHLDTLEELLESDTRVSDWLSEASTYWLGIHAQGFAMRGQWAQADMLIDELRSRLDEHDPALARLLASTMLVAQQPDQAWTLIRELADDADAEIDDLLIGVQIAQTLQEPASAATFLERASEIDPYDEHLYELLFVLRSPSSPIGNEEDLRYIVRQLGAARPRSAFLGLIRANELARNGLINEAESLLVSLNNQYPDREIGYDLLMSIWKTQSTQNQSQSLAAGIVWINDRLKFNPNSTQGLLSVAQGLFELEASQRAFDLLSEGYARTGSFELARAIEQLLDGPLDDPAQADAHLIDRLDGFAGVDPTIEYALYLAKGVEDLGTGPIMTLLSTNLPGEIELLPAQRAQLEQIIFRLTGSIEKLGNQAQVLDLLALIESYTPTLSFELARIKLLLLAQLPKLDLDRTIEAIDRALADAQAEDDRNTLASISIQSLISQDRPHEAIVLSAQLATRNESLDEQYAIGMYQLLAARGTNADMIGVLGLLDQRNLMAQTIELLTDRLGTPEPNKPAITPDEQRADLTYIAAVLCSSFEREDQAGAYYELALSYDPNNAWSNNDYGYMLAESGQRMDYAVELLERAAQLMPNEASVIDSLGWVRYKMGIFEDFTTHGMGGGRKIRGAISLLIEANELDIDHENATIMLHLGDALWRGGYTDRAINAWLNAEDTLRSRMRLINIEPNPNQQLLESLSTELREIKYRLQDAETTGKPNIAPLADEPKSNEKAGEKTEPIRPTIIKTDP